jgi:hypothetical protein
MDIDTVIMTDIEAQARKIEILNDMSISMTHDELMESLGKESYDKIIEAGFVLVPRMLRQRWFDHADETCRERLKSKETSQ